MDLCFYECGRKATTNDHIITVEDGGANHVSNYVRACSHCNSTRRDVPIQEFLTSLGIDKPAPVGVTDIEYKLTNFPTDRLTICVCLWCERPFISVKQGTKAARQDKSQKYCSDNHRGKYKRKRRPRTGVN